MHLLKGVAKTLRCRPAPPPSQPSWVVAVVTKYKNTTLKRKRAMERRGELESAIEVEKLELVSIIGYEGTALIISYFDFVA